MPISNMRACSVAAMLVAPVVDRVAVAEGVKKISVRVGRLSDLWIDASLRELLVDKHKSCRPIISRGWPTFWFRFLALTPRMAALLFPVLERVGKTTLNLLRF